MWPFKQKTPFETLNKLIAQLRKFGLFPENWLWHQEKIKELEQLLNKVAVFFDEIAKMRYFREDIEPKSIQELQNLIQAIKRLSELEPKPTQAVQAYKSMDVNFFLRQLDEELCYVNKTYLCTSSQIASQYIIPYPNKIIVKALESGLIPREKLVQCLLKIGPFIPEAVLLIPFMENLVKVFKDEKIDIVYAIDKSGRILGFLFHAVLMRMGLAKKAKFYFMNVNRYPIIHAELYSEKQKDEIKNKHILVIDEFIAGGATINTALAFFKSLKAAKVTAAVFSGPNKYAVYNRIPSWFREKGYSGVEELFFGSIKAEKSDIDTAKTVRKALLPLAELIAEYLKKKGY